MRTSLIENGDRAQSFYAINVTKHQSETESVPEIQFQIFFLPKISGHRRFLDTQTTNRIAVGTQKKVFLQRFRVESLASRVSFLFF